MQWDHAGWNSAPAQVMTCSPAEDLFQMVETTSFAPLWNFILPVNCWWSQNCQSDQKTGTALTLSLLDPSALGAGVTISIISPVSGQPPPPDQLNWSYEYFQILINHKDPHCVNSLRTSGLQQIRSSSGCMLLLAEATWAWFEGKESIRSVLFRNVVYTYSTEVFLFTGGWL